MKLWISILVASLSIPAQPMLAQPAVSDGSLVAFDDAVAFSRREMRRYCALAQQLMKTPGRVDQREEAVAFLDESIRLWREVTERYGDAPPASYANDPAFKGRLTKIEKMLGQMRLYLVEGADAASFQECGAACGLFVAMHEENGMVYALDRLYHLRKLTKTVATAGKNAGVDAIRTASPELMRHFERVVAAPCPAPEDPARCTTYQNALKSIASGLIDLDAAVEKKDASEASLRVDLLLAALNHAYGLAL